MEIEFFNIETGETIPAGDHFVMYNRVFCDNYWSTESQEATVMFDDFIEECSHVGWRVVE